MKITPIPCLTDNYAYIIHDDNFSVSYDLKQFDYGLELGAGDGYQSTMIINYCKNFRS